MLLFVLSRLSPCHHNDALASHPIFPLTAGCGPIAKYVQRAAARFSTATAVSANPAVSAASGAAPAEMMEMKGMKLTGRPLYLDFQATTPMDPRVLDAMLPFMVEQYGNAHSRTHYFGWESEQAVETARKEIAALIGSSDPQSIIFTSGATESNNLALKGVAHFYKEKKKHIITVQVCVAASWAFVTFFFAINAFSSHLTAPLPRPLNSTAHRPSTSACSTRAGNCSSRAST